MAIGRTNILVGLPPITHCSAITLRAIHDGPRSLQWPVATQTLSWFRYVPATTQAPRVSAPALRQGRHRSSHPQSVHPPSHSDGDIRPVRPVHSAVIQLHAGTIIRLASRTCRRALSAWHRTTPQNASPLRSTLLLTSTHRPLGLLPKSPVTMANSHQGSSYPSLFRKLAHAQYQLTCRLGGDVADPAVHPHRSGSRHHL